MTGAIVIGCFLWIICVTKGGVYFTKRSISDCQTHITIFGALSALFSFLSFISYLVFRDFWLDFGLYFGICGLYCVCIMSCLLLIKYKVISVSILHSAPYNFHTILSTCLDEERHSIQSFLVSNSMSGDGKREQRPWNSYY